MYRNSVRTLDGMWLNLWKKWEPFSIHEVVLCRSRYHHFMLPNFLDSSEVPVSCDQLQNHTPDSKEFCWPSKRKEEGSYWYTTTDRCQYCICVDTDGHFPLASHVAAFALHCPDLAFAHTTRILVSVCTLFILTPCPHHQAMHMVYQLDSGL